MLTYKWFLKHISNDESLLWLKQCKSFQLQCFPKWQMATQHFTLALSKLLKRVSYYSSLLVLCVGINNSEWAGWHFVLVSITQNDQTDTVLPCVLVSITQNEQTDTLLPCLLVSITQNEQTDTLLPCVLVSITQNDQTDTVLPCLAVGINNSEWPDWHCVTISIGSNNSATQSRDWKSSIVKIMTIGFWYGFSYRHEYRRADCR